MLAFFLAGRSVFPLIHMPLPARATRFSREDVHTAIGMLAARLTIPIDDAAALLRGYAYAESASVTDVAHRIVQRTLDPGLLDEL